MAGNTLVAPKRGEAISDDKGLPNLRMLRFMEEIGRRVNQDFATIGFLQDQIDALDIRVTQNEIRSKTNTVTTWLSPHF